MPPLQDGLDIFQVITLPLDFLSGNSLTHTLNIPSERINPYIYFIRQKKQHAQSFSFCPIPVLGLPLYWRAWRAESNQQTAEILPPATLGELTPPASYLELRV